MIKQIGVHSNKSKSTPNFRLKAQIKRKAIPKIVFDFGFPSEIEEDEEEALTCLGPWIKPSKQLKGVKFHKNKKGNQEKKSKKRSVTQVVSLKQMSRKIIFSNPTTSQRFHTQKSINNLEETLKKKLSLGLGLGHRNMIQPRASVKGAQMRREVKRSVYNYCGIESSDACIPALIEKMRSGDVEADSMRKKGGLQKKKKNEKKEVKWLRCEYD